MSFSTLCLRDVWGGELSTSINRNMPLKIIMKFQDALEVADPNAKNCIEFSEMAIILHYRGK